MLIITIYNILVKDENGCMQMKCSNCGAENNDEAQYCSECGNKLGKLTDLNGERAVPRKKSRKEKKSHKGIILGAVGVAVVIFIIIILVVASNNNTATGNLTYSVDSVSFDYPNNFANSTPPSSDIISGASSWQKVGFLSDDRGTYIEIQKNTAGYTPQGDMLATELSIKENNGSVLSTTNNTNPNNVVVAADIHTMTDPSSNNLLRYYEMYFQDKNGVVYAITVYGDDSDKSQLQQVQQTIFNSLKV